MRAAEAKFLLPVLFLNEQTTCRYAVDSNTVECLYLSPRFSDVCGTTSMIFSTLNVSLTSTQAPAVQSTPTAVKVVLSKNVSISKSLTQSYAQNTTVLSSLSASTLQSMSSPQISGSLGTTQIKYRMGSISLPLPASSTSKRAVVSSPVSRKILASKTVKSLVMSTSVGLKENRSATASKSPPTRPVKQESNDWKWALIGVFCGLVVFVTIVGIVYWSCKKSHAKSSQDTYSQVGVVMKSHYLQSDAEHENGLENES